MRVQLTDRFCAHARSQDEAQTDYFDETVPGLALRVSSRGTKCWTLLYGIPRKRVTLGRYPALSLAAARTAAIETRDGRTSGTVAALAEAYIKSVSGHRSAKEIERRLRKDALPIIGHIQLRELHRRDITRMIDTKLNEAPVAARRAFEDVRAMIRFAVSRGDLDHNPIDGMKGPPGAKARQRVLTDDEIRTLWQRLPELGSVGRAIKFSLVTGQRIGEVAGMVRTELDLDRKVWNIPGSRTKNGHPHTVPLTDLALELIREAPEVRSSTAGLWGVGRVSVSVTVYYNQFDLSQWTAHDLRRTVLTKMAQLGVAPIVLGHIANHRTTTKAGVTLGVYVQYEYEQEKRAALELWADRLQGIMSGGADVVSIGSKR
jgi:integrase